jgi:hypothetical protein
VYFIRPPFRRIRPVCLLGDRQQAVRSEKRYISTALLSFCDRIITKTMIVLRVWIKGSNILAGEYAL